ncbi:hypothetical protein ANCCEY_06291 [Ancylostoma ceylanicum]|uniref:G-protein coupled receptors family 1 profile domain-containing protein n=1 Tax=Ancylostoma ceylanicum TaxID=53326 RepID=A0A0D6M3X2_9BILA|nr:hypothetical protein ANCCEY_06291 [Ancylostoma ceylanicum]
MFRKILGDFMAAQALAPAPTAFISKGQNGMVVCRSYAEKFPDPSNHPVTVALFAVLYSFVFVISLAGNLGVIYATVRHRSLQTVQNIFIVNLAVSDYITEFKQYSMMKLLSYVLAHMFPADAP